MSKTPCRDHLGNSYPSVSAMCRAYGISPATFHARERAGRSLEEALAAPVRCRKAAGPDGKIYPSELEMCLENNIDPAAYRSRRLRGLTGDELFYGPGQSYVLTDAGGREHHSIRDFARAMGMTVGGVRELLEQVSAMARLETPEEDTGSGQDVPAQSKREARLGEERIMKNGSTARIVRYGSALDVDVQFLGYRTGGLVKCAEYRSFHDGSIREPWTGKLAVMKNGQEAEIIRYGGRNDIDVRFDDGRGTIAKHRTVDNFQAGNINNPRMGHSWEQAYADAGLDKIYH